MNRVSKHLTRAKGGKAMRVKLRTVSESRSTARGSCIYACEESRSMESASPVPVRILVVVWNGSSRNRSCGCGRGEREIGAVTRAINNGVGVGINVVERRPRHRG